VNDTVETVWQGKFITAKRRGKWEYVSRVGGMRAAVILAVEDDHVLLVEQFRMPLDKSCLELPAGLVGDVNADESVVESARRELEEETGYRAERIDELGEFHSSPGLASEGFMLVRASGLSKVSDGGGDDDEDIIVHRVPLSSVADFVATKRREGLGIDVKLLLLLAGSILA
jgi:ADP-ribose pyrophosphatase